MIPTERVGALTGKRVVLVCFSIYSVYIHLEGGDILTVESGFEHVHEETPKVYELSSPIIESGLMSILESTVTSGKVDSNGDLCISFSNGDTLRIFKDSNFESYRLRIAGEELIA